MSFKNGLTGLRANTCFNFQTTASLAPRFNGKENLEQGGVKISKGGKRRFRRLNVSDMQEGFEIGFPAGIPENSVTKAKEHLVYMTLNTLRGMRQYSASKSLF
jgi:hypothetical protein